MGKTVRIGWLVVLATVCVGFASSSALAVPDYTMSLLSGGANSATVDPGQSLSVDLVLATSDGAMHDGNDLNISFSRDGLVLTSWDWASPEFVSGGASDFTRIAPSPAPSGASLRSSLPQALTSTFGIGFGANTDAFGSLFGTGTLISFGLTVPDSYEPGDVMMDVSGTFTDFVNFTDPQGTSTGPFTLHITPEPATLMLLGIGGLAVLRRRRSA